MQNRVIKRLLCLALCILLTLGSTALADYTSLKYGMENNDDVRAMQARLYELGYMAKTKTGNYWDQTADAVAAFQEAVGLPVSRKTASPEMQEALFAKDAPRASSTIKPKEEQKTEAPEETKAPAFSGLKYGMSNNSDVRKMQDRLYELGYMTTKSTGGYYSATIAAVELFQKAVGQSVDGKYASDDLLALLYADNAPRKNEQPSVPTKTPEPTKAPESSKDPEPEKTSEPDTVKELKYGMSNNSDVRKMQNRLRELGYMTVSATGGYYSATREAVGAFQKKIGMAVNNKIASVELLTLLYSDAAPRKNDAYVPAQTATPAPQATETAAPAPIETKTAAPDPTQAPAYTELKYGMSKNDDVRKMQERLFALGYMKAGATGNYYSATTDAVAAFQKAMGLPVNGRVASAETLTRLYGGSGEKKIPTYSELKYGMSKNSDVSAMQSRLKALGYMTASATGNYYSATQAAVAEFQKTVGLPVNGNVASAEMQTRLFDASAPTKGSVPTSSPTLEPSPSVEPEQTMPAPSEAPAALTELKYGMSKNADVEKLQDRLKELGYMKKSVGTTGNYYAQTQDAVKKFLEAIYQTGNGKTISVEALEILYSDRAPLSGYKLVTDSPESGEPQQTVYTELKYGMADNEAVRAAQARLKELGYMKASATGGYYSKTESAVKDFQSHAGLKVDGKVISVEMQELLFAANVEEIIQQRWKDASNYKNVNTNATYAKGSSGTEILTLNTRLSELGYLSGSITSSFDSATQAAVMWFQNSNGLTSDGVAGPNTLKALYSSNVFTAAESMDSKPDIMPTKVDGNPYKPVIGSVISVDFFSEAGRKYYDRKSGIFSDGSKAIVTDVATGISYQVQRVGGYNHADVEPCTEFDTWQMYTIYDEEWAWTRRSVYVTLSDGTTLAASINGMPHGQSHVSGNNMDGHTCIHFLNSRTHGSNKVDAAHQAAVKNALNANKATVQARINAQ